MNRYCQQIILIVLLLGLIVQGVVADVPPRGSWTQWDALVALTVKSDELPSMLLGDGYLDQEVDVPGNATRRRVYLLNKDWTFLPIPRKQRTLGKPQTVSIPFAMRFSDNNQASWFVKRVSIRRVEPGFRWWLRFSAVRMFSIITVNGKECGRHLGAFTPFEVDITDALKDGDNVIAIYVHDASAVIDTSKKAAYTQLGPAKWSAKYWISGGIRGSVKLEKRPAAHVADVFVNPSVSERLLRLSITVGSKIDKPLDATLSFKLLRWPDGEAVSLKMPQVPIRLSANDQTQTTIAVPWADPLLWSPEQPRLYVLRTELRANGIIDVYDVRFGFRDIGTRGKQFILNGIPIKLRGSSAFHMASGLPEDQEEQRAVAWFEALKQHFDINAVRLHAQIFPQSIIRAADQAGILLINQSGIWSAMASAYTRGGQRFVNHIRREFGEWVRRDRNNPSVFLWDVENEMLRGAGWRKMTRNWALELDRFVLNDDTSRLINHSGAGWYAPDQQVVHLHMQEHYTRILQQWQQYGKRPLVLGEFWIGGRGESRLPSSLEIQSSEDYWTESARINEAYCLGMRYENAAGWMPFQLQTIGFQSAQQKDNQHPDQWSLPPLRSDKITESLRHALASVTVFFWPRIESANADGSFQTHLVVANDSQRVRTFQLQLRQDDQVLAVAGVNRLTLKPGEQWRVPLVLKKQTKRSTLSVKLNENQSTISQDKIVIRAVANKIQAPLVVGKKVLLFDSGDSQSIQTLQRLIPASEVTKTIPDHGQGIIVIIPPAINADSMKKLKNNAVDFLRSGGAMLCLAQNEFPSFLPIRLGFWNAQRATPIAYQDLGHWVGGNKDLFYSRYAPIYASSHPVFRDIPEQDLRWWDRFDGRVSDHAFIRPAAISQSVQGAWRTLAGGCRYENISLAECRIGQGTVLLSQAQVLKYIHLAEPRTLFGNMIRWLDEGGWSGGKHIAITGSIKPKTLMDMTGISAATLRGANPAKGDLLLAGDGADPQKLNAWAMRGGQVVVLSSDTASRLPGYQIHTLERHVYLATRKTDHPLFWGLSSANFTDIDRPLIRGTFETFPKDATSLFGGLESIGTMTGTGWSAFKRARFRTGLTFLGSQLLVRQAGSAAVLQKKGKGQLIVTTFVPWDVSSPQHREFLSTLLANAGVDIPVANAASLQALALKTVPIQMDGKLNDWLQDIEDANVSPYIHAQPIVIPSGNRINGAPSDDAHGSAILYFLWHEKALYMAGTLLGNQPMRQITVRLGNQILEVQITNRGTQIKINGKTSPDTLVKSGTVTNLKKMIDTNRLALNKINYRTGRLVRLKQVPNRIFEARIPWKALLGNPTGKVPRSLPICIDVQQGATLLRTPLAAKPNDQKTWGTLIIDKRPGKTKPRGSG